MENQTTTNTGTNGATEAETGQRAGKLGALLKTRFAGVKAQLDASQARMKGALQSAVDKVKSGLDLPSKSEVSSLAQRIEELDKKLADYETRAAAAGKGKKKEGASEQFA
ncbi:MAG TPA: phasin family protein [Kofleriaceae bacterium]|jgi:hypothetical protein|nr:phasin family protein [Kofleriaceae bacterium]